MKMNRTKFLKEAKEKYKDAIGDKGVDWRMVNPDKGINWVSEMNFIYDENIILRVWFDVKEGEYMHRWCTVSTLPSQDKTEKERSLIRNAGQILCAENDEEMAKMIERLRKALKTQPDQTADYIDGVTMWQNVEYSFTVKAACEYIGIIE